MSPSTPQALYNAALEESADAILIVDLTTLTGRLRPRIVFANDAYFELTGYDRADLADGIYPVILGRETDVAIVDSSVASILEGRSVEAEVRLYTKPCEPFWAFIRAHPLRSIPGYCVLTIHDVSEQRAARSTLDMLSEAVDNAMDFILVTELSGDEAGTPVFVYANRAFLEATGYERDDLTGKPYTTIYSSDNDPRLMDSIRANIETGAPNYREMRCRRKDGSDFWIEFVAKPFTDRHGHTMRISVGRDITLRRRTTNQMSLLFRAMAESPDRIILYELDSKTDSLESSFENDAALDRKRHTLLELLDEREDIRAHLASGSAIEDIFVEDWPPGHQSVVALTANALRNGNRIEAVLTREQVLQQSGAQSGYGSRLLTLANLMPALRHASTRAERLTILRALLLDAFGVHLRASGAGSTDRFDVDLAGRVAYFSYAGQAIEATWSGVLDAGALTAMRFLVEAAMELDSAHAQGSSR